MTKVLIVLLLILISSFSPATFSYADEGKYYWAKIEHSDTVFYALADENTPLFVVPQSYFVKLTDEENGFYKVLYKDAIGYIKKELACAMNGTPNNPYFNENFRIFIPSGVGLYASAQLEENYKILTIPYLSENLQYYGSLSGQTAIPDKSDIWYYCKYDEENFGYVYSSFCDKFSSPPKNLERFPVIENPKFTKETKSEELSSTAMTFIIIGVTLPCLIVFYLLIKPNTIKEKLPKEKVKYKSNRKRDYFEFDQSDLN